MSWLKIETTTPMKPEIGRIAKLCSCSRADAFLAFFKFYSWADSTTESGEISFLTSEDVDEHSGLSGFGNALEDVGWVSFTSAGALIINWQRHNGKSAKRRTLDAERKRQERAS